MSRKLHQINKKNILIFRYKYWLLLFIPTYWLNLHDPVHYTASIPHFFDNNFKLVHTHILCKDATVPQYACCLFCMHACWKDCFFFFHWVCTKASICRVSPGTGPPKTSCSLARVEKEHSQMAVNVQTHRWLRQTIQSTFLFCSFAMTSNYSQLFVYRIPASKTTEQKQKELDR